MTVKLEIVKGGFVGKIVFPGGNWLVAEMDDLLATISAYDTGANITAGIYKWISVSEIPLVDRSHYGPRVVFIAKIADLTKIIPIFGGDEFCAPESVGIKLRNEAILKLVEFINRNIGTTILFEIVILDEPGFFERIVSKKASKPPVRTARPVPPTEYRVRPTTTITTGDFWLDYWFYHSFLCHNSGTYFNSHGSDMALEYVAGSFNNENGFGGGGGGGEWLAETVAPYDYVAGETPVEIPNSGAEIAPATADNPYSAILTDGQPISAPGQNYDYGTLETPSTQLATDGTLLPAEKELFLGDSPEQNLENPAEIKTEVDTPEYQQPPVIYTEEPENQYETNDSNGSGNDSPSYDSSDSGTSY